MPTLTALMYSGAADFLEQVVHGRFQSEVFQGRGHQAMTDIPDQLDGIINDLAGLEYGLELGGFILVHQVFV